MPLLRFNRASNEKLQRCYPLFGQHVFYQHLSIASTETFTVWAVQGDGHLQLGSADGYKTEYGWDDADRCIAYNGPVHT